MRCHQANYSAKLLVFPEKIMYCHSKLKNIYTKCIQIEQFCSQLRYIGKRTLHFEVEAFICEYYKLAQINIICYL